MMRRMSKEATIKTALVTGAGKRIGREIALYLAREGWDVALHCRHSSREAEALAAEIVAMSRETALLQADLADAASSSALIGKAANVLGPLSLLVHNAAVFEKEGLTHFSHESFTRHMAVNLEAPLHLSRDFAAQAPAGSNIICLLDGMEGWSMSPAYLSYALSKQGLREAVRLLARPLAPKVRINGIAPGATLEGIGDAPDSFKRLGEKTPLQRTSAPREILAALAFLLGSPGVTGQVIDLSGGMGLPPLLAAGF